MVHIHAEGPAFFCWIPKLFGKRVICTIHGLDWDREKWRGSVASKFIRGGEKNAAKYADEIIVLSKDVQKYFLETYGRETHFIPNGVNRPEVREAKLITDHFGLKKDSYILFLGRLVPEKGIRYLVEAFKNVKTDKKLVIAGGSSDTDSFMEELKDLAKGDDRIFFTGFVQGAMLDELYSNAYIYTLPSDLEGMPLSRLWSLTLRHRLVCVTPSPTQMLMWNLTWSAFSISLKHAVIARVWSTWCMLLLPPSTVPTRRFRTVRMIRLIIRFPFMQPLRNPMS